VSLRWESVCEGSADRRVEGAAERREAGTRGGGGGSGGQHERGCSHPPALGKSQKIKGTPLEPRQRGCAPLHSPLGVRELNRRARRPPYGC
jgi:hypothetical protein